MHDFTRDWFTGFYDDPLTVGPYILSPVSLMRLHLTESPCGRSSCDIDRANNIFVNLGVGYHCENYNGEGLGPDHWDAIRNALDEDPLVIGEGNIVWVGA